MPLDRLAPDQRAVVQLVLQQGRSYDDLASMLGISADAVRARAHAGIAALTDAPAPADAGELADFLLGQQDAGRRAATERRLASDAGAREWALLTAGELGDVAGDRLPAIPDPAADAAAPAPAAPAAGEPETQPAAGDLGRPRPRPLRDAAPTEAGAERVAAPATGDRRSSRLGGALLIGGLAILVAAVLILVIGGGDDEGDPTAATGTTTGEATPAASATPQALGQIPLQAVEGQTGRGVLALFGQAGQGIVFTLAAERVPALDEGQAYAMWLTKDRGSDAQLLGFFQEAPQGKRRQLATSGPRESDQERFAGWLTSYDNIVVSKETVNRPSKPTTIVLSGDLPESGGGEE